MIKSVVKRNTYFDSFPVWYFSSLPYQPESKREKGNYFFLVQLQMQIQLIIKKSSNIQFCKDANH